MERWEVWLDGRHLQTVSMFSGRTEIEIYNELVRKGGYDSRIRIRRLDSGDALFPLRLGR